MDALMPAFIGLLMRRDCQSSNAILSWWRQHLPRFGALLFLGSRFS
jgi:hypothetical protein